LESAWIPQTSLRLMSSEEDMSPAEWNNYKKLWRHGPRGLEDNWTDYAEFAASARYAHTASNTGVVWAGENHGCPCRFHQKSSAETKREAISVGRHPERPDRLQKILESWQKNTYAEPCFVSNRTNIIGFYATFVDCRAGRSQRLNWRWHILLITFKITSLRQYGINPLPPWR